MTKQPTTTTPPPRTITSQRRRRTLTWIALTASLLVLAGASTAHAGTYVINNCPSAPTPNGDPGPWTIFGSPQTSKGGCGEESGGWVGPRGGSMGYATADGVQVTVPAGSGITIQQAKEWWSVPHEISGAENYALAIANGSIIGEYTTPAEWKTAPAVYALPSTTTTFTLEDFCSDSLGGTNCTFGGGLNPDLQLYGSQLTLADDRLPTGKVTGGALAGTQPLSGTQSLAYTAEDTETGVRAVRLLIDGQPGASNDYLPQCPYNNFQACPASEVSTISWNTASVPDGQHTIEAIVENAAQNTNTFYDAAITTQNAPVNNTPPTITTTGQPVTGATLTAQPGIWSTPAGAGTVTYGYQWQDCSGEGDACQAIPDAQNTSYTPASSDIGHTLTVTVTATDNDGQNSIQSSPSNPVLSAAGSLDAPPSPGTSPGASSSTTEVGAPNGTSAAETAVIHLEGNHVISRTFAKRAFKLTGRLTDSQDTPITGATLDVLQQIAGTNTLSLLKHTTTSLTGAFTVAIPAGPSRRIEFAYRAYTGDASYAATATVTETVNASVQLHIRAYDTSPTTIVLSGQVSGPIPPQGTLVELLVYYHGYWEPFRTPHTNQHGSFHATYQFQGAIGRFPFKAEIPPGQASFPYTRGYSHTIDFTTG